LALIAGPAWAWFAREIPALRVTVLAVGRGSTTVIELPDGQTILYDVGSSYASDVSETVLLPFLRSQGIRHVDRIYISHPNLDHFSGLPGLLNELPSSPVIINDLFDEKSRASSPSRHLLDLLALGGHELDFIGPSSIAGTITRAPPTSVGAEVGARYGPSARIGSEVDSESASTPSAADSTRWTFGGADFELLSPLPGDAFSTANDTSTVMRITYAGRSILLTGDIDEGAQRTLLARGSLHADVLLLPHHGSVRSTTRQFLQAVNADFLIRSSNERMDDTINGLQQIVADGILYNTADDGAVTITFDKVGVTISPHLIQQ
jgi:competence protein ComEC